MTDKKYTLPEDDAPKMAGEPVAAYKTLVHYRHRDLAEAISGDELKRRLHESLKSLFV